MKAAVAAVIGTIAGLVVVICVAVWIASKRRRKMLCLKSQQTAVEASETRKSTATTLQLIQLRPKELDEMERYTRSRGMCNGV